MSRADGTTDANGYTKVVKSERLRKGTYLHTFACKHTQFGDSKVKVNTKMRCYLCKPEPHTSKY